MVRFCGVSILALGAFMSSGVAAQQLDLQVYTPASTQDRSADVVSSNVLKLKKSGRKSKSASYLGSLRSGALSDTSSSDGYGTAPLENLNGFEYIVEMEWDGQPFEVIVDTGSSDTWLVQAGFTCVDYDENEQPEELCQFGPVFNGTFGEDAIPDQNFNISYMDGEFLTGVMGYETVTLAGITVDKQEVALVNYTYWRGDNITSGLLGLAYPVLTSAFAGNDPTVDSHDTEVEYSPIITTMIDEGLIPPVFSLALVRNSSDGYLALGGLPPVDYTEPFASAPVKIVQYGNWTQTAKEYSFYTIFVDAWVYEGSEQCTEIETGTWNELFSDDTHNDAHVNATQFPSIVDSGTWLTYLPTALVNDIAALFDPPAVYIAEQDGLFAPCNASIPSVGVQINGTVFYINDADLLIQYYIDPETGYCLIGLQDGYTGPYILGDTFMNNVVSVFDLGANEVRFAAYNY